MFKENNQKQIKISQGPVINFQELQTILKKEIP